MDMNKISAIIVLLVALTALQGQDLIMGANNKMVWGRENTNEVILNLDFKAKVKPISLLIGYDNPNGIKFRISYEDLNIAVDLRYILSMKSGMDEWGDRDEGYFIQAATHDFDNDKNPEIIIVFGDGLTDMSVNVVKYHPPTNPDDAIRRENWTIVGNFSGQDKIFVDSQVIKIPIGSQGLFEEFTWINSKFVKTN